MNLSSIEDKIPAVAFALFRKWTKNAQESFPDYDFTISNEQVLVNELKTAIAGALKELFKPKNDSKRFHPGWECCFISGFIEGMLGRRWFTEYISKRSKDYKLIMALNAMELFLENDESAKLHTNQIYKELITNNTNLRHTSPEIPDLKGELKSPSGSDWSDALEETDYITRSLESLRIAKIMKFISHKQPDIMPGLRNRFSVEEITRLIADNDS